MSAAKIIPKEQLSAYQRWEMDALGDPPPAEKAGDGSDVVLPTAEEVERIHQQASQEGFAAGYQEGKAQAQAEAQCLNQLLTGVAEEMRQLEQNLGQQMVALILEVSKQMLRQALKVRPELMVSVVREAINSLPQAGQHPHLILHPRDAALVRSHMAEELAHAHWRIVEDNHIQPGGCRLETASSEIDATMESRWQQIVASLGQSGGWLD
ncbi:MAG: flagellar assembly protein FliH [Pseudomonadota bacterium]|jgi:flagellar assembly protein FliH